MVAGQRKDELPSVRESEDELLRGESATMSDREEEARLRAAPLRYNASLN